MPKGFAPGCRSLLRLLDPKLPFRLFPLQSKFSELLPSVTESPPLVLQLLFFAQSPLLCPSCLQFPGFWAFFSSFPARKPAACPSCRAGTTGIRVSVAQPLHRASGDVAVASPEPIFRAFQLPFAFWSQEGTGGEHQPREASQGLGWRQRCTREAFTSGLFCLCPKVSGVGGYAFVSVD